MNKTLRSSSAVMQLFEDLELARLPLGNQEHEAVLAFDRYLQNLLAETLAKQITDAVQTLAATMTPNEIRAALKNNFGNSRRHR